MATRSSDRMRKLRRSAVVSSLALALALASACSGSSGSSSSQASSNGADVAAAQKLIAPYIGQPGPFPDLPALTSKPAAGSSFSYLQCTAASCAVFATALKSATAALGVKLNVVVAAGASATDVQSAMATIVSQNPAAVLLPAIDPTPIVTQIKALVANKVPVVGIGVPNPESYGLSSAVNSNTALTAYGKFLAAQAVVLHGSSTNVAFYNTPELSFAPIVSGAFKSELAALCPNCTSREVTLTISKPTGAPATVVADLQSHPSTNIGVFDLMQLASGLPAALKTAGLTTNMIGMAPSDAQLASIKAGDLTLALTSAQTTIVWTAVDVAARLLTGQSVPADDTGVPPIQMLRQQDITFDTSKVFTPYDDAAKFASIWK